MKADIQATREAGFKDYRSFIAPDGREVLYGDDWKARIEELRARSYGICEWQYAKVTPDDPVTRCSSEAQDPHHVIRRSVKRDDRLANLQALCRYHHDLLSILKPKWRQSARSNEVSGAR